MLAHQKNEYFCIPKTFLESRLDGSLTFVIYVIYVMSVIKVK